MSKATTGIALILSSLVLLGACSKQDAKNAAAPAVNPTADAPAQAPGGAPHPLPTDQPTSGIDLSGIAKAEGGKTIAEVYADKNELAGKPVTVRGKVVKANANILGKNWLHIRDGSAADATGDLAVTTAAVANVGDTVLVTGPLSLNKDYGMGYQYSVIVEDAQVSIEQ